MRPTIIIILLTQFASIVAGPRIYSLPQNPNPSKNILSDGLIYKLKITESGIYRLTADWLFKNLEISSGTLKTAEVQVYGIGGGPLLHNSTYEETEHLSPLPMQIADGSDGRIDIGDFIQFYAEGPDKLTFNENKGIVELEKNPFSEEAFVFLKILGGQEQCLIGQESLNDTPTEISLSFWYANIFHRDKVNLLDGFISTQGSGQLWFGDELSNQGKINLKKYLTTPARGLKDPILQVHLAGRSGNKERITISANNATVEKEFSPVNTKDIEALYAREFQIDFAPTQILTDEDILLQFDKSDPNAQLWLDYISLQGLTEAIYDKGQLVLINPPNMVGPAYNGMSIKTDKNISVWDVTDYKSIINKKLFTLGDQKMIHVDYPSTSKFICFDQNSVLTPLSIERIIQQDIVSQGDVEMLIISPDLLKGAAEKLKNHRAQNDLIKSLVLSPSKIYNEYSGGRQDPTALRNYVRDLYHQYPGFSYLLLFGDASFDYRHINKNHPADNLVPTFETFSSLDPLLSFPSDDYFGLLDNDEDGRLIGDLDIAIGRLTVSNPSEADNVVNKIINYDRTESKINSWKTTIAFLADDEDNNLHVNDADVIATEVINNMPLLNQEKIYFDAFRQESTPGGNRYPSATQKLNLIVERGALIINYLGHGGPNGWAQERVLKVDDINNWSNFDRLPLIITATCSFTGFDDPSTATAGEAALLNPVGGALALFTTVRSVYASKNFQLTRSVFHHLFEQEKNEYLRIGEIMRRSKNENVNDNTNARKFFLIGDPTSKLSLPNLNISTEKINGIPVLPNEEVIRLSALDQVRVEATVRNPDGSHASDYNGEVDIVVFDKPSEVKTFANDDKSFVKTFKSQQNIIYKGRSTVKSGQIDIIFTIPVDIDYQPGAAKISYFAISENSREAAGYSDRLSIGGMSVMPVRDDSPPEIEVYLNKRTFRSGDLVPPLNMVIVDLTDDYGLNVSSTGIGHEITGVLDQNSQSTLFLNDFLQGNSENPLSGTITFPLENLSVGQHELTIKAFDVANNSNETTINFVVSEQIERKVTQIIARPNPLDDHTSFEIQHDLLDGETVILMRVFDLAGRLVEEVQKTTLSRNGLIMFDWSPKIEHSGHYICHFIINSRSSKETTLSPIKKVTLLK